VLHVTREIRQLILQERPPREIHDKAVDQRNAKTVGFDVGAVDCVSVADDRLSVVDGFEKRVAESFVRRRIRDQIGLALCVANHKQPVPVRARPAFGCDALFGTDNVNPRQFCIAAYVLGVRVPFVA